MSSKVKIHLKIILNFLIIEIFFNQRVGMWDYLISRMGNSSFKVMTIKTKRYFFSMSYFK